MSLTIKPWIKQAYQEQYSSHITSLPVTYLQFLQKNNLGQYIFTDSELKVICEIPIMQIKKLNNSNGIEFDRSVGFYYQVNDYSFKENALCILNILCIESLGMKGVVREDDLEYGDTDEALVALYELKKHKNEYGDIFIENINLSSIFTERGYSEHLMPGQLEEFVEQKNSIEFDNDILNSTISPSPKDDDKAFHMVDEETDEINRSLIEQGKKLCKNIFNFFSIKNAGESEELLKSCDEENCIKCELIEQRSQIKYRFNSAFDN